MTDSSFLSELYQGRLRWDLVRPFPAPGPEDRRAGDAAIAALDSLPLDGGPPATLLAELARHGLTRAMVDPRLGGRGLSPWATFQLVAAAITRSLPTGLALAAENAFGLGALLPQVPEGPLRQLFERWLIDGVVGGLADTEPVGAANLARATVAADAGDGRTHLLTGEKLFVSNAPIASVLTVSATVDGHRRLLVVDADDPGVQITEQRLMGLDGFPIGRVRCDHVRVRSERIMPTRGGGGVRITAEAVAIVRTGKVFFTAAPSLVLARQLLDWAARYVSARTVDGAPLAGREEVQRRLAEAAADVYAIGTLTDWALLTPHTVTGPDAWFERSATKNATTALAWRVADRLVPLLAGEGYETAPSKLARGADRTFPVERAFRDLMAFRIAGGVDFYVDAVFAEMFLLPRCQSPRPAATPDSTVGPPAVHPHHVRFVAGAVRELAAFCGDLLQRLGRDRLHARQRLLILVNRLATELLTAALVLARSADPAAPEPDLADLYCTAARQRVEDLWRRLRDPASPDHRAVAARVLAQAARPPREGHARQAPS